MKNFTRREFACKCGCGFDTVDYSLIKVLGIVREHFGVPVTVTSGARCLAHNESVGGVSTSQHTKGRAADIVVRGVDPAVVAGYVKGRFPSASIGTYDTFTHIDTRSTGPVYWG